MCTRMAQWAITNIFVCLLIHPFDTSLDSCAAMWLWYVVENAGRFQVCLVRRTWRVGLHHQSHHISSPEVNAVQCLQYASPCS